jgi:hypothetical protein
MDSDATALQETPQTMSSDTARMMPEGTTVSVPLKTAATVSPTEGEIAAVAYQLWLNDGCPAGSDREDWFRAEAMVKNALVAKCEHPPERPSIPRGGTRTESEMAVEFRWVGHWEVWESEWGGARWIWDYATPGLGVSNRAG